MKNNKKVIFLIIGIIAALLLISFIFIKLNSKTNDEPIGFGDIELDDDGNEVLGSLEEDLLNSDGSANPNLATFDKNLAKSMGANHKVEVLFAEKELDETVINKKNLYFVSGDINTSSDNLNYVINYIFQEMTGGPNQDLFIWITQEGDVFVDLDSSVYTGLMTEYFPLQNYDPTCTDFSVDKESASKSIHLLLRNTKLVADQLMSKDKDSRELKDIYFIYNGIPGHIEGVTDENGKML